MLCVDSCKVYDVLANALFSDYAWCFDYKIVKSQVISRAGNQNVCEYG